MHYSYPDYSYPDDNDEQHNINFLNLGSSQIVDKGTTIKLPCNVDMYPKNLNIVWRKNESYDHVLAIDDNVIKQDSRISVEINREGDKNGKKGSTLLIALAEDSDDGQYVCQLTGPGPDVATHKVTVRGIIF